MNKEYNELKEKQNALLKKYNSSNNKKNKSELYQQIMYMEDELEKLK